MSYGYEPPKKDLWQGRKTAIPGEKLFERIQCLDFDNLNEEHSSHIGLLGFATSEGVRRNFGRVGAHEGPTALRKALGQICLQQDQQVICDWGNVYCEPEGNLIKAQQLLTEKVATLRFNRILPVVLGGGHETAWGHFPGLIASLPRQTKIGILNWDAHFDLRPYEKGEGNSGTPFLQIAHYLESRNQSFSYTVIGIQEQFNSKTLFETANKWRVNYLLARECFAQPHKIMETVKKVIADHEAIYLSLCLDVFCAALAPGVSAPQALGLLPPMILDALILLANSGKLVGIDVVELAPCFDRDDLTAKLGAQLLGHIFNALPHR